MAEGRRAYDRRSYARKVAAVARVCRRMEDGETVTEICRDPTMPSRSTLMSWLARHPELREQVEAVRAAYPDLHARRAYHYWSEAMAAEVLGRIADGRGLAEVCAEGDMPVHSSVTRWLNERPEFAAAYRRAREAQADTLFDLAWRIARDAEPGDWQVAKLKIDTLKWRVGRLAPRKYGPWTAARRQDGDGAPVQVEVRRFAYAPDGVKDITVLARGLDADGVAALTADIEAGRAHVPQDAVLAEDEYVAGAFILRGGDPEAG